MKVKRLTLKNFRNVEESTFFPDPTLNFLVGSNGQGKTSFIEALGFLSTLRSFRDSKVAHLIRWGTPSSEVSCSLFEEDSNLGDWHTELRVAFQMTDLKAQRATKVAFINGKPYSSATQYLSQRFKSNALGFHAIIFNPSDHDLVRGDPGTRRSYLDRVLAAEDVDYLKAFQKYHRTLVQRNALLKSGEKLSSDVWGGFTESLCTYGALLVFKRLGWIQRMNTLLNPILQQIAPRQPALRLTYLSNWANWTNWVPNTENLSFNNNKLGSDHFTGQGLTPSLKLLEQSFWAKVSAFEAVERKVGYSLIGPHRDDWTFFIGDQVLKGHGSQGEVRSALLALKLSEIELFREETGHPPLFLLDDFSSELDRERRLFLLRFLMETDLQTFVTTTEDSTFVGKRYWVSNGAVEEGKIDDDRTKTVRFV